MVNQNAKENNEHTLLGQSPMNQLEWGEHNKELSDLNFIDRKQHDNVSVDLSKEESGRNRKGVKEGENSLSK